MLPSELEEHIVEHEKCQDADVMNKVEAEYNTALEAGGVPKDKAFCFGVMLCLSPETIEKRRGIRVLNGLIEAYLEKDKGVALDSMYYVSIAHLRLGQVDKARIVCERLLRINPDNNKARDLHTLIRSKLQKQAQKQVEKTALVTAVGVGVGLLAMAFAKSK